MKFPFKFNNAKRYRTLFFIILVLVCIAIIAFSTGFPYDEASFLAQYFYFYIYGTHIFYYWPFGTYYYILVMSGFLVNIPFSYLGLENVLIQEFSIKLPFLISMLMATFAFYLILVQEKIETASAKMLSILFLLTPIILYDAAFHGNGLIISLFFELFSIVFLYKHKYYFSAIFLGMAAASYLFPIFFIIPIVYFVKLKTKISKSLIYFMIFSAIFLVGQGLPIMFYFIYGIPLSQGSILGGIIGVTSNGLPNSTVKVIATWGPYFILQELSGYVISLRIAEVIFAFMMILPGIFFIIIYKDPSVQDLIEILFVESLLFLIFGLYSNPQYLTAIAPFSVLLFSLKKESYHLNFLSLLTFADIGAFIASPGVMFGFFQDLNPQLGAYYLKSPTSLLDTLESLYVICLFIYLFYFLYHEHLHKEKLRDKTQADNTFSELSLQGKVHKMASYLVLFTLITVILVAPGIQHPPPTIPSEASLMQESYNANMIFNNTSENSSNYQYSIDMGSLWSSMDGYAKSNGTYELLIPSSPHKNAYVGDFAQTFLINAIPHSIYSENFYFPFASTFHGFFVIFGNNVTPLIYLENSSPNHYLNLTDYTYKVQTVDKTHNFFEVIDSETVSAGYHTLMIKVPQSSVYLSVSHFNESGANFRTYISSVNIHENVSSIPTLMVNSTLIQNTTLSLYLSLSSTISAYFNGIMLGNYSTQSPVGIKIPGNIVKSLNVVVISGYYNGTGSITLKYGLPLSFSAVIFKENLPNLIIGIAFFAISVVSLWYLILFVRRGIRGT